MRRIFYISLSVLFFIQSLSFPTVVGAQMTGLSMPTLRGLIIYPSEGLKMDFLCDEMPQVGDHDFRRLIRVFLAGLTFEAKDIWVNLSPLEPNRIMNPKIQETDLGEILAQQDLLLKQRASMLTHPDTLLGKNFWNAPSSARLNNEDLMNDLSKVWITPQSAEVFYEGSRAVLGKMHLQLKSENNTLNILIPSLEDQINHSPDFLPLRQIYGVLILAQWFKTFHANHFAGLGYINSAKINGIDVKDESLIQGIYNQYLRFFKKGAYQIVREDVGQGEVIARKYVAGGLSFDPSMISYIRVKVDSFFKKSRLIAVTVIFAALVSFSSGAQANEIAPSVISIAQKGDPVLRSLIASKEFKSLGDSIRMNGPNVSDIVQAVNSAVRKNGAVGLTRAAMMMPAVGQDAKGYFFTFTESFAKSQSSCSNS